MNKSEIKIDTSIKVGDKVRSYDFPDDLIYGPRGGGHCYAEGDVMSIVDHEAGYKAYKILVSMDRWRGEPVIDGSRIGTCVYAPVNGTRCIGGEMGVTFGVIKLD